MEVSNLKIRNYKSIKEINIDTPGKFMAFVGANASGKSNIFESLEFASNILKYGPEEAVRLSGDVNNIISFGDIKQTFHFVLDCFVGKIEIKSTYEPEAQFESKPDDVSDDFWTFVNNFSRIFIGKPEYVRNVYRGSDKLSLDGSNLDSVLSRILNENMAKDEIHEELSLLIPRFKEVIVKEDELTGKEELLIYESNIEKPFGKNLISDGTFNILCLLSSVLQNSEPQFLCIEEPENGLSPKVIRQLVHFFREKCKEFGHYIWLNTHSQTLVSELNKEELVIVDKKHGYTTAKQISDVDLHGLKVDEAWLANVFEGGIPW